MEHLLHSSVYEAMLRPDKRLLLFPGYLIGSQQVYFHEVDDARVETMYEMSTDYDQKLWV